MIDSRLARFTRRVFGTELGTASKWIAFASVIGLLGGLAAVLFDGAIHLARTQFSDVRLDTAAGIAWPGALWVVGLPTAGGLLVGLMIQTCGRETEGHGTDSVIKGFHQLAGAIRARVILIKPLTSLVTIGTGGSAGQEGPVAQMGAAIGSTLANACRLSERDRRTFMLSGATAGIGAMFCSPMGGALFMPEVLYKKPEFEGDAIIPCIISSIVAYATFTTITGRERAIEIPDEILSGLSYGDWRELFLFVLMALVCTVVGWVYTTLFYGMHDRFQRLRVPFPLKPAIGGLLLGLTALGLSALAPGTNVFFGGYDVIHGAIEGDFTVRVLGILLVAKILATCFSIASGGSGGVFAPSLAIGGIVGALGGELAATVLPSVNPAAFALVGMGGFFAGVSKTPVASVVMVCEMTGGYGLLAPLLLVSVVHMLLSARWTLYRAQVPGQIDSSAHAGEFVVDVLERMQVKDLVREARPPRFVEASATLRQVLRIVSNSRESYFPVVDESRDLVGVFSLADIRRIFLEDVVEDLVIVRDFMTERVVTATLEDNLHQVLTKMTEFHINSIPIVEAENSKKVIYMLQRNDLGRGYDRRLRELKQSQES